MNMSYGDSAKYNITPYTDQKMPNKLQKLDTRKNTKKHQIKIE